MVDSGFELARQQFWMEWTSAQPRSAPPSSRAIDSSVCCAAPGQLANASGFRHRESARVLLHW